ncbi:PREDICTED: probable serine/threonine-protein kinase yakA isoform X1 [Drosophila arizonae]|uniref:Probable serine/threonine-protein kinase yakA isoform X1 n=1 Tax=Drosophila arizonae TaxID=7263 RepID=A0ABM1NSQ2_DROAR|nr:PREDICTED: probable serine/threonine-protein kinase yakA isoform X1 [Drosophila arizonae]
MAMHSYMRANPNQTQTNSVNVNLSPDEVNNFLKDKQAWEHAISLYQGPDPLDHWYNYICWYENHAHSDPDRKFRETLERCLTVYEHDDYYRQDVRLVRLWLKYIAMQTDQLRFYQVLFQRGTGRQVAAFYIGWASYYEAHEQFKDAEAVFNLAFQEKAHSSDELQSAHAKFTYSRSMFYQQQQQQQQVQQLQQQHQQQHQHQAPPPHDALQQLTAYTQSHHQQQEHQHQHQQPVYPHPAPATALRAHHLHQENFHQYQQHPQELAYLPHIHGQQPQQQQQPPPPTHYQQQEQPPPAVAARFEQQFHQPALAAAPNQTVAHPHYSPILHQNRPATNTNTCYEAQAQVQGQLEQVALPATSNEAYPQQQAQPADSLTEVGGVRLPRNFHAYGRNNHETWKPALTLEEPDDPSRVCHYAKQLVYPAGAGIEYSPEELLARKYIELLEQRKQLAQAQAPLQSLNVKVQEPAEHDQQLKKEPTYPAGQAGQQQQQQLYDSYQTERSYYMSEVNGELYAQHTEGAEEVNSEPDEDDEGEEQSEEESDEEGSDQQDHDAEPVNQEYSNGVDGNMHFSAKTTFEEQNRSIKIKFKKERTLESSTYSAYKIESIYHQQQELPSPAPEPVAVPAPAPAVTPIQKLAASPKIVQDWSGATAVPRQRNGNHHFHPYMLGQTSTPKSTANESRRARSKAKQSKFQRELCSNSNSSCSVPDQVANGVDTGPGHADSEAAAAPIHNATFNDNANFSFSSAGGHDNSNNSLALAVDGLHVRDASHLACGGNNKSQHATNNNNNNNNMTTTQTATSNADFSTFQENSYFATQHDSEAQERRLSKALETIDRHMEKVAIDPFNSELCRAFLTKLNFPGDNDEHASYKVVQTLLPKISNTRTLNVLDSVQFNIDKEVGRGSYGSVYKATDTRSGNLVALKYQKPPNSWEIYICDQVLRRIRDPQVLPGLMDISTAIIAPNASLIATEFSPFGSLLDINNKIRQATTKVMHESLVMHFSAQICNIVDHLHKQHIIHADIKPDNFLLMRVPNVDSPEPSLRLIDFGCAIDLSLFPDGERTKFRKVVQTDGFTCIEMQEGRSWSFETDLFCIASTVHVMLFGEYMQPEKRTAGWEIRQKVPRYLKKHVWSKFFSDLLNMQADKLPQLQQMRDIFEKECRLMDSELQKQIRTLSNILHRR